MKVKGTFLVSGWEEKSLSGEAQSNRISQVSALFDVSGDIKGQLTVEYLMHSTRQAASDAHDADAAYLGYLLFTGAILDESGSFVVEDKGTYSPKGPESFFTIMPNTGTGAFSGISGSGKYYAGGEQMIIEIEYSL